jgi:hypothetical protein
MAALIKPLASAEEYGRTTFNPGQLENQTAKHCECCAAVPAEKSLSYNYERRREKGGNE